jgi:hypothetical protein
VILENLEQYGYAVDKDRIQKPVPSDSLSVRVLAPMHMTDLALAVGTDYKAIKELNPQILGSHLPAGSYVLRVPQGLGLKTAEILSQQMMIANQRAEETPEKSGQRIAILPDRKPAVEQAANGRSANGRRWSANGRRWSANGRRWSANEVVPQLAAAQPAAAQPAAATEPKEETQQDVRPKIAAAKDQYYVVRPGDTLSHISNRKKVPIDVLRKLNDIQGSQIKVGQKLRLAS